MGRVRPHGCAQALNELILGLGGLQAWGSRGGQGRGLSSSLPSGPGGQSRGLPLMDSDLDTSQDLIGIGEACPFKPHPHATQES